MNYTELKDIAEKHRILIKHIASELSMTVQGLQTSLDNQTLPIKKVIPLCSFLGISLNDFFGVKDSSSEVYYGGNNQKTYGNKSKNIQMFDSKATEALIEQIRIKDAQLKEKDEQIAKLISKL